ncbi:hypothetical protein AK830_g5440 [Neonectria ditissima]|uniref:protein-ribulosamine 3-kinase n=1 Tax=Neonectria ditissima TaxID=78410 RepID=A0A0P7BJ19_9HYPO|nr:hypothetical protein AK830_g5440 [Neonectria ditissima]
MFEETSTLVATKPSSLGGSASSSQTLDTNVILGIYCTLLALNAHGADRVSPLSAALPARVKVLSVLPSGSKSGDEGRRMMEGSFESETLFYHYSPSNVPKPLAWGCWQSDPDMWFYLSHFHDMVDKVPEPQEFVSVIAQIHKDSMGNSPTGKYGFQVSTHLAYIPNDNTWQTSWEVWFTQAMRQMFTVEEKAHGKDENLELLKEALYAKVIPRLLRPLETGANSIQPTLIHSDLWPGNCMTDKNTGHIMVFDSCAFWGHNEADLGSWRALRYKMGRPFFNEYQKKMGVSEPKADWDDRNALYALRYDLLVSALFAKDGTFREMAVAEMQRLVDKYPRGYEGE